MQRLHWRHRHQALSPTIICSVNTSYSGKETAESVMNLIEASGLSKY